MNGIAIMLVGFALLFIGYVTYGRWLAHKWGADVEEPTPAHTMKDGVDYVPAKAAVLMGHHFSSIAGAGPINGPIQAAIFGWVPVFLWIVIGGIFFGAVQDFSSLYASIKHKGQSIGAIIAENMGGKAKRLFLVFAYLTLLLVVAAFASIVAGTFNGFNADGTYNRTNGTAASISVLFILISVIFGFFVYRRNAPIGISSLVGVAAIVGIIVWGMHMPIYLSQNAWMYILGVYILIASVTPVWILLQPRDYLSSFLLYGMMIAAVVGIIGANPRIELPAFAGFGGIGGGSQLFPVLFITVACGAISGFHSLVGSGTTAKQLDRVRDAKLIGYGGMLIECGLAIIALIAVGFLFKDGQMPAGTPTQVFAGGLATMLNSLGGAEIYDTVYALIILAVSAFALTSLDTATRLARYMFAEFFLNEGELPETVAGPRKVLVNPWVGTVVTVALGLILGFGGYSKIWPLFGAANQLLAALALMAVAAWLGNIGRDNSMFYVPMLFMLLATITSLCITIWTKVSLIIAGAGDAAAYLQSIFSAVLIVLSVQLVLESADVLFRKKAKGLPSPKVR